MREAAIRDPFVRQDSSRAPAQRLLAAFARQRLQLVAEIAQQVSMVFTYGAPVSTARSVARLTRVLMDNTLWLYLLLRRSELWRFRDCRPRSIHRAECWPGTDANRLFRAHDGNGWTLAAGRRSEHSSSLKKEALGRNVAGARPLERASCSISR